MKKIFLAGVAAILMSSAVMAQETGLFPELQGQFKKNETPAAIKADEKTEESAMTETGNKAEESVKADNTIEGLSQMASDSDSKQANVAGRTNPVAAQLDKTVSKEDVGEKKEGNLKIELKDVQGTLAYARTLSYCSADVVLTNQTNRDLRELALVLTYGDMKTDVAFGSVPKKGKQAQKILLIGPPCEQILAVPKMDIKACELDNMRDDACKKRVQFVPPNG